MAGSRCSCIPMKSADSNPGRFREARERAGMSITEMAMRAGISEPCVWDLESHEDELMVAYSSADLQQFAAILNVRAAYLLGTAECNDPITHTQLASAIREHCKTREMTIEQFSGTAGWEIAAAIDSPDLFLSDFTLDGIQDICRELVIDWARFVSSL
jgi:transcriptional regulator with XRE-family HTH domain